MQQQSNNPSLHQNDDEIDLRELWQKLVEGKWLIAIIALLTTLIAVVYTQLATPIYEGKVSVEIGQVILNRSSTQIVVNGLQVVPFDTPADLSKVLQDKFQDKFQAKLAKGTSNIVEIKLQDDSKDFISHELQLALDYVQARHQQKAMLYQDVTISPTQQIAPIAVGDKPIKPKSTLIIAVAVVLGLMLGVFMVLVRNVINRRKVQS